MNSGQITGRLAGHRALTGTPVPLAHHTQCGVSGGFRPGSAIDSRRSNAECLPKAGDLIRQYVDGTLSEPPDPVRPVLLTELNLTLSTLDLQEERQARIRIGARYLPDQRTSGIHSLPPSQDEIETLSQQSIRLPIRLQGGNRTN